MIFEIVFYTEYSDGSELNYKFYNLRGDVVLRLSEDNTIKSKDRYFAFGEHISRGGNIKTDMHRANTKVEDSGNLLNEGKRFRQLEYGIFLTPDPLEYVDGYNPYIYCGQNPWGKWDPLGLAVNVETAPGTGNVRWCNGMLETYAAVFITRTSGSTPESAKDAAYLAVKITIFKKNVETKSVLVATPVQMNGDSSQKAYVRLFLQDHANRLRNKNDEIKENYGGESGFTVEAEYAFIAGKMSNKFSPSKVNIMDTSFEGSTGDEVLYHEDSTFYAKDRMYVYNGENPSDIMDSSNKFDGGNFKLTNTITDFEKFLCGESNDVYFVTGSNSVSGTGFTSKDLYKPSNEKDHPGSIPYKGGDSKAEE